MHTLQAKLSLVAVWFINFIIKLLNKFVYKFFNHAWYSCKRLHDDLCVTFCILDLFLFFSIKLYKI